LHRTVFYTCFFYTKNICHRETCTHRLHTEVFTDRLFGTQKLYPEQFLHSRNFFAQKPLRTKTNMHSSFHRQTVFTHRKFSAQKSYAQKVLRTAFFTYRRFYTQMSLHRHKLHTETCAHSTRLHTTNFYAERLCFLFLITYLSCSPLSSHLGR